MIKWAFIFSCLILFVGCSNTTSVLTLSPYEAKGVNVRSNSNIIINSILDKRKNQSVVATITDKKGTGSEYITLRNNLTNWFNDALIKKL